MATKKDIAFEHFMDNKRFSVVNNHTMRTLKTFSNLDQAVEYANKKNDSSRSYDKLYFVSENEVRGSNPKKRKAISAKSQSFGSWGPTPGSFSASTAGAYFYPHVASKNLSYKIVKSGAKFLLYHDGKNFISEHTTIPLAKRSAAIHMRKNFSDEKPAPTRRLKKRRAKNTEPGYFPNPSQSGDIKLSDIEQLKYFVQEKTPSGWLATGAFHELEDAKEYATLMSESSNTSIRVVE